MSDYVITFLITFFENAKSWVGRTTLNVGKKRDGLNVHIQSTFALQTPRYYGHPVNPI